MPAFCASGSKIVPIIIMAGMASMKQPMIRNANAIKSPAEIGPVAQPDKAPTKAWGTR